MYGVGAQKTSRKSRFTSLTAIASVWAVGLRRWTAGVLRYQTTAAISGGKGTTTTSLLSGARATHDVKYNGRYTRQGYLDLAIFQPRGAVSIICQPIKSRTTKTKGWSWRGVFPLDSEARETYIVAWPWLYALMNRANNLRPVIMR
jgi:hypothetical protein